MRFRPFARSFGAVALATLLPHRFCSTGCAGRRASRSKGPISMCNVKAANVLELLGKLRATTGYLEHGIGSDRFTAFSSPDPFTDWVFTKPSELAYPAVSCRHLYQDKSGAWLMTRERLRCEASREACDALYLEFQELDQRMKRKWPGRPVIRTATDPCTEGTQLRGRRSRSPHIPSRRRATDAAQIADCAPRKARAIGELQPIRPASVRLVIADQGQRALSSSSSAIVTVAPNQTRLRSVGRGIDDLGRLHPPGEVPAPGRSRASACGRRCNRRSPRGRRCRPPRRPSRPSSALVAEQLVIPRPERRDACGRDVVRAPAATAQPGAVLVAEIGQAIGCRGPARRVEQVVDHRVFQHALDVAAGLVDRDRLDPVDESTRAVAGRRWRRATCSRCPGRRYRQRRRADSSAVVARAAEIGEPSRCCSRFVGQ